MTSDFKLKEILIMTDNMAEYKKKAKFELLCLEIIVNLHDVYNFGSFSMFFAIVAFKQFSIHRTVFSPSDYLLGLFSLAFVAPGGNFPFHA